jgi:succinyl-diaminopimelate desuccinylase
VLDLTRDPIALAAALIDQPSVSGQERELVDAIEEALRKQAPFLRIDRYGNTLVAKTERGASERILLAGHVDTVPIAGNLPSHREGDRLYGCGASDMKSGLAVLLHLAVTVTDSPYDLTYLIYDCEEVEAERNGLNRLAQTNPDELSGNFAVLLEPTGVVVEGGCQGTMRIEVSSSGTRAHSARSWLGTNAIHGVAEILARLNDYEERRPIIDGLEYREGLQAVKIAGGVATNVIPDECVVTINYRFAPDRSEAEAEKHLREFFSGYDIKIVDSAPGALPGLSQPAAGQFLAAVGGDPRPKYGWTDVARFSAMGIPAVNFGPGDPNLAHTVDEWVDISTISHCYDRMYAWLTRKVVE